MGRQKGSRDGIQRKITPICVVCKKEFQSYPSISRTTCSIKCFKIFIGKNSIGKKRPEEWKKNIGLGQIAEQIDVRISSRIAGMCKSVKLSGNDRRLEDMDKKWKQGEAKKIKTRYLPL